MDKKFLEDEREPILNELDQLIKDQNNIYIFNYKTPLDLPHLVLLWAKVVYVVINMLST